MTHLDDEAMALLALGDATPDADQQHHLDSCARCEAEVASLTRLVRVGRASRDVEIVSPPDGVWSRIHDELGLSDEVAQVPRPVSPSRLELAQASAPDTAPDPATDGTNSPDAAVVPRRRQRATSPRWWLVAAALVVGVASGSVASLLLARPDAPQLVAEAVLAPLPDWSASGSARVEVTTAGAREIVVSLSAPEGGLREVWLIDPDTSGLVSLGLLGGPSGTFSVPAAIDLDRYSVVDVSEEPDDGNPAHSGDSIVRGPLSGA